MTLNGGRLGFGAIPRCGANTEGLHTSDQAFTTTTPTAITGMSVVLPAAVDDVFLIGLSWSWGAGGGGVGSNVTVHTFVGGSAVNSTCPGNISFVSHYSGGSFAEVMGSCYPYTIVPADLDTTAPGAGFPKGKTVTFTARASLDSASSRTVFGSSVFKTNLWALPLGRLGAFPMIVPN